MLTGARMSWGVRLLGAAASIGVAGCDVGPDRRLAKVAAEVTGPRVEEVRVQEDRVYVHYTGEVGEHPGVARVVSLHALASTGESRLVTPLRFEKAGAWRRWVDGCPEVPVLSEFVFEEVMRGALEETAPAAGTGLLVEGTHEPFVVWRDGSGATRIDPQGEVGEGVEIVGRCSARDLREAALEQLERRMGPEERRTLVLTGQRGWGASPFMYADLDRRLITLLSLRPPPGQSPFHLIGMVIDLGLHVGVKSLLLEAVRSPVRLTTRAVSNVGSAVGDGLFRPRAGNHDGRPPAPLGDAPPMDLEAFEARLDELTGTRRVPGRVERVLVDGDEFFPVLESAIETARRRIWIRTYLFDTDDFGVSIADRLRKRGAQGVDVRVLTNGLGDIVAATLDPPGLPDGFDKPVKMSWYLGSSPGVSYRSQSTPLLMGDHAKTTIIDGRRAFIGGMNIGRESRYDWHDLMFEVTGPVVADLEREFESVWELAGPLGEWQFALWSALGEKPEAPEADPSCYPVRILKTKPGAAQIYEAQLEAMRRARQRIYIENLYFSNTLFLKELIDARRRGVDVRVVIPMRGNWGVLNEGAMITANRLFEAGVRVYMYPTMTHAKAALYDGWACVGSANFDRLSFRLNDELNLCYTDEAAVRELIERVFEPDFEASFEMKETFDGAVLRRLSEIIAELL